MAKFIVAFAFWILSATCLMAQTTYYFDPVRLTVTSGVAGVPYNVTITSAGNNVDFKAEDEINIVRDMSSSTTETLITSSATSGDKAFHAYLVPPQAFAELTYEPNGSIYGTIDNRLSFKFTEKYKTGGLLNWKIYNYQRQQVTGLVLYYANQPVSAAQWLLLGTNYFTINLTNVPATTDANSVFMLEVTDSKGEKSYLRFKLIRIN